MISNDRPSDRPASTGRRRDPSRLFAGFTVVVAVIALVGAVLAATRPASTNSPSGATGDVAGDRPASDDAIADASADPVDVVDAAAAAMADVTSVEFELDRNGAPIFIDQFESIALDSLIGQFTVPGKAAARLAITVDGNLATYIGAVALGDEVWISNPVTGNFETLPAGYDIDPSKFFDPTGGWQPLLSSLEDVELISIDDRGGERYHVRGQAPAAEVTNITVGLVREQAITIDLWIHPTTSLVTAAEFATVTDDQTTQWSLQLDRYGDDFTIEPPVTVSTAPGPDRSSDDSSSG